MAGEAAERKIWGFFSLLLIFCYFEPFSEFCDVTTKPVSLTKKYWSERFVSIYKAKTAPGVSNIRHVDQNWPCEVSNLAQGMALENVMILDVF